MMLNSKSLTPKRQRVLAFVAFAYLAVLLSTFPTVLAPRSHAALFDASIVSSRTREGRLAIFDDAWATINQRYYDSKFHGLDWEAQRSTFRSLAAEATSTQELYAVLRRMIAALNDPHTRVFAPDEKFDWWKPRFITVGLVVREVDGLPTVVRVERGSAPHRAGVRVGDVIETVDGEQALAVISKRIKNYTSPDKTLGLRAFAAIFEGQPGSIVEVRWQTKDGKFKTGRFERYWQQRDLGMRVRREGEVAIVEMDAFTKPIASSFASALKEKLANTNGIVLDFRNNGGGDAEAMIDVASAFLGAGLSLGQFTDRYGGSYYLSTRRRSPFAPVVIEQTKVPLVVLSSERTSSAAEIFIAAVKANGRARVLGSQTCGCVLAIRHRHTLPDGGLLDVSEMDYQTAAGERLEKHSIEPHETIRTARNDLYADRDPTLESAVKQLNSPRARLN